VDVIRSIGFERLMRWGAGALVLLLAHGLGAPRSAWAGCNHLVTSQSDRGLDFNRLDDLITGSSALLADDTDRERPGPPGPRTPRPCSGPGCSSGVPWPASTASPSSGGPDQWIALESILDLAVASPPRLVPDEPAARPAGHKPSIFHPPPA
jgi:hypothetical protein